MSQKNKLKRLSKALANVLDEIEKGQAPEESIYHAAKILTVKSEQGHRRVLIRLSAAETNWLKAIYGGFLVPRFRNIEMIQRQLDEMFARGLIECRVNIQIQSKKRHTYLLVISRPLT